jgi:hypothetical protein
VRPSAFGIRPCFPGGECPSPGLASCPNTRSTSSRVWRLIPSARREGGATVTATVTFHAQLSTKWCAAAKRREEAQLAAKRRHEAELREAQQRKAEARAREEAATRQHEETSECTNGTYINSRGNVVCKPQAERPAGATAECEDGTFSSSESRSGTCSHYGGVKEWL